MRDKDRSSKTLTTVVNLIKLYFFNAVTAVKLDATVVPGMA
jgi:hypothetical protein